MKQKITTSVRGGEGENSSDEDTLMLCNDGEWKAIRVKPPPTIEVILEDRPGEGNQSKSGTIDRNHLHGFRSRRSLQSQNRTRSSPSPIGLNMSYSSGALLASDEVQNILAVFENRLRALYRHIDTIEDAKETTKEDISNTRRSKIMPPTRVKGINIYDNIHALMSEHATDMIMHEQALRDVLERTRFRTIEQVRTELIEAEKELEGVVKGFEERLYALLEQLSPEAMRRTRDELGRLRNNVILP